MRRSLNSGSITAFQAFSNHSLYLWDVCFVFSSRRRHTRYWRDWSSDVCSSDLTDQWYPELVYDNHPVAPPGLPEDGYHLSKDIADKTIEFIRDAKVIAPDKPWFSYVCPGAGHAPHHVFKEWVDRYAGKFDMGYERYREIVLENQKKLGIVPPDTELSPINPYLDVKGPNGEPWPAQDTVRPWDSLGDDDKRLFCRMAEVFAGFLSYTDAQIGRVLDYLEGSGQLDNTIIVVISDNGASS